MNRRQSETMKYESEYDLCSCQYEGMAWDNTGTFISLVEKNKEK
jgi:hypothetical protein